jgi:hypothetical protein
MYFNASTHPSVADAMIDAPGTPYAGFWQCATLSPDLARPLARRSVG